jgi:hypothetical protein
MDLSHNDGVMVSETTQSVSQPVEKMRNYYLYALVIIFGIMLVAYLKTGSTLFSSVGGLIGILGPILIGTLVLHFVTYLVKVPTRSFDKALFTSSIMVVLQMLSSYGLMSMRSMSQYLVFVPIPIMIIAEWILLKTIYKTTNKKTLYVILVSLLIGVLVTAALVFAILSAFRGSWS